MGKILIALGQSRYQVLRVATEEIAEGFREYGYDVEIIDVSDTDGEQQFQKALQKEWAFYFSMQGLWWEVEKKNAALTKNKRVAWLVDDPVYHALRLEGSTGRDAFVLCVCESHTQRIRNVYPGKFASVRTLYHGGFEGKGFVNYRDKDIDVFFPGTYTPLLESEQKIDELDGGLRQIAEAVKPRIVGVNLGKSWIVETKRYLAEIGFSYTEEEFRVLEQVLSPLDSYQRNYMREKIIDVLLAAGVDVSVVGEGWQKYNGEGREHLHIISDKGLDINEVTELMHRSKIVLNNINFYDGLHERIFTAMLSNAVCLTHGFELLDQYLEKGRVLVTYEPGKLEELQIIVKDLLENPTKAEKIALTGYQEAKEKHTWKKRGIEIAQWMERQH